MVVARRAAAVLIGRVAKVQAAPRHNSTVRPRRFRLWQAIAAPPPKNHRIEITAPPHCPPSVALKSAQQTRLEIKRVPF